MTLRAELHSKQPYAFGPSLNPVNCQWTLHPLTMHQLSLNLFSIFYWTVLQVRVALIRELIAELQAVRSWGDEYFHNVAAGLELDGQAPSSK